MLSKSNEKPDVFSVLSNVVNFQIFLGLEALKVISSTLLLYFSKRQTKNLHAKAPLELPTGFIVRALDYEMKY